MKSLEDAFGFWDQNEDGKISIVEFSKILVKAEGETPPFKEICDFFGKSDTDKSGDMDLQEFCQVVKAMKAGAFETLGEIDMVALVALQRQKDLEEKEKQKA